MSGAGCGMMRRAERYSVGNLALIAKVVKISSARAASPRDYCKIEAFAVSKNAVRGRLRMHTNAHKCKQASWYEYSRRPTLVLHLGSLRTAGLGEGIFIRTRLKYKGVYAEFSV